MKPRWIYFSIATALSILAGVYMLARPIWTVASSPSPGEAPISQIAPTETPPVELDGEVLMTNPALLQVIILLGIIAVLVIFIGVWFNRRKVTLR